MGNIANENLLNVLERIFKEESVCNNARNFILGKTKKINSDYCYFNEFFYRVVEEIGLDNDYFKRTVEALFISEVYDAKDLFLYS